jgi:amino acid adenylation domain-containing protein
MIEKTFPTTEVQKDLWGTIALNENATLCFNKTVFVNLEQSLTLEALNIKYQELLKKHDVLRMTIAHDGKSCHVMQYSERSLVFLDYSNKDINELENLKNQEMNFKYDLTNYSHRGFLVKTGIDRFTFLFTIHQLVCDNFSLEQLLNELLFNRATKEESLQFSDYDHKANPEHVKYWSQVFSRALVSNAFPLDFKRPKIITLNSKRYDLVVPPVIVASLKKIAVFESCSFYNVLVTIYSVFLYQISKSEDIVLGIRSTRKNDILGPITHLIALRTTFKHELAFDHFLKIIQKNVNDAFSNDSYSYTQLVKDSTNTPFLSAVFNYEEVVFKRVAKNYEIFDLSFNAVATHEGLTLECQYNPNLFTAATLENWSSSLLELMNLVIDDSKRGVKSLKLNFLRVPPVTSHDEEQLLADNFRRPSLKYWEDKLKAPLPILELPVDFKRPLQISHKKDVVHYNLKKGKVLRSFIEHHQLSSVHVFLTTLKITLARYSGLHDIIVGTEIEKNIIALRSEISLNLSFEENLKRVERTFVEAHAHHETSLDQVLDKLDVPKDLARSPVFQVFFDYYTGKTNYESRRPTDLDMVIEEIEDQFKVSVYYREDLYRKISIERFIQSFLHTLDHLSENFQTPLTIIKAIPSIQEELILSKWNNFWEDYDYTIPFYKIFEQTAKEHPNRIAIEASAEQVTYGELNKLANRCANLLIAKGIGRGSLVGVSLTRNSHLIATLLGILKSGAGYVPLDPAFPQERLDYMIANSIPKVLITEESLIERFKGNEPKILVSEFIDDPHYDKVLPEKIYHMNDTIYVIYTSGSSGNPKGVEITYGAATNFLYSMKEKIKPTSNDMLLAVTTLSFDIAVLELFLPLISGASIYLAGSTEVVEGPTLTNILTTKNITIMQATPSLWRLLLASEWKGGKNLKILCGGEPFPIVLAQTLIPLCKEVWNMYGPTETTVWSTCKKLGLNDQLITVGKPIANTSVYVLDQNRYMQPIGVTGELFIGGHGLSKGYFGREDLTAERFMPDPFTANGKMYATGDLARYTYDGEIECLGRNDGQVKIQGIRIELGEIEAELQRLPEVSEVSVITLGSPENFSIVAYISLNENTSDLDEKIISKLLAKKLPLYMIPTHYMFLEEIPKTLNGKIDKKSLPKIKV